MSPWSSSWRAPARASSARCSLNGTENQTASNPAWATAHAQTPGATSASRYRSSLKTTSNPATPSRKRPCVTQSRCSADASCNAELDLAGVAAPGEGCAQVVHLGFGPRDQRRPITARLDRRAYAASGVVVAVAGPYGFGFAGLPELFQTRTGGRSPAAGIAFVPATVFGDDERLVDEQRELVEDLVALQSPPPPTAWAASRSKPPMKRRQSAEQDAFGFGQQRVRPVDRGAQGLLAAHRRARAAGQQAEPVVQAVEDLGQRQRAHPRGGQLDRQRHAVEPAADLGDGRGVVVA